MLQWLYCLLFLLLATYTLGQEKPIALIGTILLPNQSINNGTLVIIDGHIAAVGVGVFIPNNAIILHTNGVILPGLIDLHNHLTWNIFPRWKPIEEFGSRYDWQEKAIYKTLMTSPHKGLVEAGLTCEMQRYAEVKAITQGATSVIGSLRRPCNRGLARNLDDDPTLGQILYNVYPLQMTETILKEAKEILSSNGTLLVHLAEGSPNDTTSAGEFSILKGRGLLRPGVSLIHGVALKESDFRAMANASVGFVWSPRSNLELYGETANLKAAIENDVITAIAPDWSPTGSDGLLSELNYAATWNFGLEHSLVDDRLLLEMATINPAKLVRLDKRIGVLKEGYLADVLVLQSNSNQSKLNPFWAATHATPEDVMLVMIDGKAVYGDPKAMKQLVATAELESLEICGIEKSISFASQIGSQPPFRQTQRLLNTALRHWGRTLAPLSECGN
jgi:5-methylthioadenosine/S-adenosylhomocysteine deaminase